MVFKKLVFWLKYLRELFLSRFFDYKLRKEWSISVRLGVVIVSDVVRRSE